MVKWLNELNGRMNAEFGIRPQSSDFGATRSAEWENARGRVSNFELRGLMSRAGRRLASPGDCGGVYESYDNSTNSQSGLFCRTSALLRGGESVFYRLLSLILAYSRVFSLNWKKNCQAKYRPKTAQLLRKKWLPSGYGTDECIISQPLRNSRLVLGMLLFGLMNVLFEAATIEGRARALGKRHQKEHLHDSTDDHLKSNNSNRRFSINSRIRRWLISMTSHVKILVALAVWAGALFSRPARASYIEDWTFPSSGTATQPISATSSGGTSGTPTLGGTLFSGGATAHYIPSGGVDMVSFTYAGLNPGEINSHTLTLTLTANTALTLTGLAYSTSYNETPFAVPVTQTWTYAITGGSSGTIGAVTLNNGSVTGESLDPDMTLGAGQTITLTDTFSGAFGLNGALDFGNISITAVPEPMTWALIGFGMVLGTSVAIQRAQRKAQV